MKFKTRLHTEGSRDWPSARPDRGEATTIQGGLELEGAIYANENFAADHHIQSLPAGGLRHVDGCEEAPIAIGRAGQNQQEGWGQIHRVGISFIGHQSRAQTGQEDRAGLARDRLVARSLFHRDLRHHQSAGRLEAQVYADRHSTKPLQWPLPWLD